MSKSETDENKKAITQEKATTQEKITTQEKVNTKKVTVTDSPNLSEANIATLMYYNLNKVFGGGSQLFAMEFPGRIVNRLDYAYPIDDYNSTLSKPYIVAENEFRLADNMMDLSPIVQGPNGSYLSNLYNTAIHNYTPKIDNLKDFVTDKMELRLFLMEKITDEIDGEVITCSRMEFCQKTYLRYLENKYKWDQEKIDKQKQYTTSGELDEYAKWLATTSWTKDHELETLFNDAVVRGFYHEIMTILGFLDISSPAERLTAAKQNKRSSVRRSIDSSRDILPVRFEPSNWFRSLMPNYSPQDLTLDADYLATEYKSKRALLTSLEAELRVLVSHNIGAEDISKLENQVALAKKTMLEAEKKYYNTYTQAQVEAIKLAFEIASKGDIVGFISGGESKVLSELMNVVSNANFMELFGVETTEDGSDPASVNPIEMLIEDIYTLYAEHLDYFTAFNELMNTQMALTQAQTSEYDDQIEILSEKIKLLKQELNQISVILTSDAVHNNAADTSSQVNTDLLPISKYDEDTTFTDIVFNVSESLGSMSSEQKAKYASFSGRLGNWFINSSTSVDYDASSSKFIQSMMNQEITIGMRATKVTIDRGGWFDPSIFDISGSYMKLDKKISAGAGLTAQDIMDAFMGESGTYEQGFLSTIQSMLTYRNEDGSEGKYILPAFPTSFIIVKDVVIKFSGIQTKSEYYEEFRKLAVNTSTQIFGFRMTGGYGSQSSMGYQNDSNGSLNFYIRIPGPQILGWFMEMTPKDNASDYQSLSKSEYFNDIMSAMKDYREKMRELESKNTAPISYSSTVQLPL